MIGKSRLVIIVISVVIFLGTSVRIKGQQSVTSISNSVCRLGFENVAVKASGDVIYLSYENNLYRSDSRALAELLKVISPEIEAFNKLSLLIRVHNTPVLAVTVDTKVLASFLKKTVSYEEFLHASQFSMNTRFIESELEDVPTSSSGYFNIDIPVGIGVRYLLGAFDYPVRTAIDLQPGIDVCIAKGLSIKAQCAVPLYNDLDANHSVRPGIVTISKDFSVNHCLYTSVSAGSFTRNRIGIHGNVIKYFFNEALSVGLDAGYTSYTSATGKVDYPSVEDHNFGVYAVRSGVRIKKYDLNVTASYGRFLYQDEGFLVDVYRQFSETTIGFFALSTTTGTNAGIRFSIPIPPSKYSKPGRLRIRPDQSFSLSYRVVGGDRLGRQYLTGDNLISILPNFYPSFICKDLQHFLQPNQTEFNRN